MCRVRASRETTSSGSSGRELRMWNLELRIRDHAVTRPGSVARIPHSKFRLPNSSALQPVDDLLARPVMIVVQVQDDRVERQAFVATLGTAAADVLEAVEQPIETWPDRVGFF